MKLTDRQELKTVAEVKAELLHHNECVDAWTDAMEWLENAVKDKLDKKATKAILTKWQTEYTSGHRQEKDLGNGLGWEIYMGQSPYDNECNMIYLNACDVEYYSNGQKFLKPVRDFYTGQFEYPKGATWKEVIDAVRASDRLLQATLEQDADMVAVGIEKAHAAMSHLQYNDENSLSCRVTIYKGKGEDAWTLRYEDEGYEYYCNQEELLTELSEHMDNMKGE